MNQIWTHLHVLEPHFNYHNNLFLGACGLFCSSLHADEMDCDVYYVHCHWVTQRQVPRKLKTRTPQHRGRISPQLAVPWLRAQTSVECIKISNWANYQRETQPLVSLSSAHFWSALDDRSWLLSSSLLQAQLAESVPRTGMQRATAAIKSQPAWLTLFIKESMQEWVWGGGPLCLCALCQISGSYLTSIYSYSDMCFQPLGGFKVLRSV